MHWLCMIILLLWIKPVSAAWEFDKKLPVSPHHGDKIFHHLDSAGRKNIAVSDNTVAVVWEDNHTGASQIYITTKSDTASSFDTPQQVSTGKSQYG